MTLEVRVPISPTPAFFNRVRLIAKSVREWYPDAIMRVSVGKEGGLDGEIFDLDSNVSYRRVKSDEFAEWAGTQSPYLATVNDTWKLPYVGDYVLHLDADVLPLAPFDELFDMEALSGVMAHVPPCDAAVWSALIGGFGGTADWLPFYEHSGAGIMCPEGTWSPAYFNSGVVFGPRHLFEKIAEPYAAAIRYLRKTVANTYWFDQVALALAIAKAEIPINICPLRYNFPNQRGFDERHPGELAQARLIHYLRTDTVDRDRDFASDAALRALVARTDLTGSNERLRARVAELIG